MKYVYKLLHKRKIEKDIDGSWICDTIGIGIYSTREKAEETIERYKHITGFKDYPDDFVVEEVEIDFDDYDFKVREEG